jgi:hypothetical protein
LLHRLRRSEANLRLACLFRLRLNKRSSLALLAFGVLLRCMPCVARQQLHACRRRQAKKAVKQARQACSSACIFCYASCMPCFATKAASKKAIKARRRATPCFIYRMQGRR